MLPYPLRALFINDFEPKKNLYSHHFGSWKETVSEQTSFQYLWCFFFFDELFCFKFDFSYSDSPSALKTLTILHAKDSHSSVWGANQGFLSLSQWWKFSISLVHFLSIYIIFFIVQLLSYKTLELHGWQHARLPCPSLSPGVKFMFIELVMQSNHLIFCHPFSFCLQSFPASGSFPVTQLFASSGWGIGSLASA